MASLRITNDLFERALDDSLKDFVHIRQIKEEQKRCLRSLAEKKDVFGILPTGFGKSLIFQILPRVLKVLWSLDKTSVLVVTPLVSIMKDQVEEMRRLGLKAFAIGLCDEEMERELRATADVDIIYGSPESLCSPVWAKELKDGQLGKQIVCLVVDEAHAVSAWGEVTSKTKQRGKKQPFREAFARVKDLRSFLPGLPILALTASVKVKDRSSLWKSCGMVDPIIVDVAPNKENICLEFHKIADEKDALKNLKWVASMIQQEKEKTPQTIIFCKTFNDIANVVSYLLMNLRGMAFVERDGKKLPLLGVYHAKTWDTQKKKTEEDFKESGIQRVVVATCALGMGINFQNVEYVLHFGPPQTVTEIIQQSSRAGRSGQQAFSVVYATNRQLSKSDKDVKGVVNSETCMRVALYQHFQETPSSKEPGHLCCTVCRKNCKCDGDGCTMADVPHLSAPQLTVQCPNNQSRNLSVMDKDDLNLALNELKEKYSAGVVSLFHEETIMPWVYSKFGE
ncbi:hypothetical protein ACROYT_G039428 [Oculina patagonica]